MELMEKVCLNQPAAAFLSHQSLSVLAASFLQQMLVGKLLEELLHIHSLLCRGLLHNFSGIWAKTKVLMCAGEGADGVCG